MRRAARFADRESLRSGWRLAEDKRQQSPFATAPRGAPRRKDEILSPLDPPHILIAAGAGWHCRSVRRLNRLGFLSAWIVGMIAEGRQPSDLTVIALTRRSICPALERAGKAGTGARHPLISRRANDAR